jgi:hypothetical protein
VSTKDIDRIEEKILLRVPPARVWRALTDAEEFGAWFGAKLAGAFAPGASKGRSRKRSTKVCRSVSSSIESSPSACFMALASHTRWTPDVDYSAEPPTLVVCELEEAAGGTVLTVESADRIPRAARRPTGCTRRVGPRK